MYVWGLSSTQRWPPQLTEVVRPFHFSDQLGRIGASWSAQASTAMKPTLWRVRA